jgi:hypothetical protein
VALKSVEGSKTSVVGSAMDGQDGIRMLYASHVWSKGYHAKLQTSSFKVDISYNNSHQS